MKDLMNETKPLADRNIVLHTFEDRMKKTNKHGEVDDDFTFPKHLRVVVLYIIVGGLWVLIADYAIIKFTKNPELDH